MRQRHGHTVHGARAVHCPSNRSEIFFERIRGVGLRPQEDAVGLKRALDTGQGCPRMGHVVDAVEGEHEIEPISGRNALGGDLFKEETIRNSRSRGLGLRPRD
jgi:hypothetical protein